MRYSTHDDCRCEFQKIYVRNGNDLKLMSKEFDEENEKQKKRGEKQQKPSACAYCAYLPDYYYVDGVSNCCDH